MTHRVLIAVGDVSGKGIPAALFMAVAMTLLRSMARQGKPLEAILRDLNDELLAQNPRGMFVTLQCLVFDLATRTVTCASAGHHGAARIVPGQAPRLASFQASCARKATLDGAMPKRVM